MKKTVEFLRSASPYFLATSDGGQPRVRPCGAMMEYQGKLYFCTSSQKRAYQQIKANPKVEICAYNAQGAWVRICGEAVIDSDQGAKEAMLANNDSLKRLYSIDDGIFTVFYLKNATATFSSFATEPEVHTL